jgi:hypothetical protein
MDLLDDNFVLCEEFENEEDDEEEADESKNQPSQIQTYLERHSTMGKDHCGRRLTAQLAGHQRTTHIPWFAQQVRVCL